MPINTKDIFARLGFGRARVRVSPIDWRGVSFQHRTAFEGHVSAICKTPQDCEDLVKYFGDPNFMPEKAVVLLIPGKEQPVAIQGLGYATAAELRECAVVYWYETLEAAAKGERFINLDEAREKAGMPRREKADELIREALWEAAKKTKSNPISNPTRQPVYPNPKMKQHFPQHPGVPYRKEVAND